MPALSFLYPYVLLALLLLPLLVWNEVRREKKSVGFAFPTLSEVRAHSWGQAPLRHLGLLFRLLALAALIVASARPQGKNEREPKNAEGLDIMLVLDSSQSMLAMDFELKGQRQNRLDVVKSVVEEFIQKRLDDRIGLVVFGSQAFTQAPLTMDHKVLLQFLRHITVGMAGPETAIGDGLGSGIKRLKDVPAPSKILILLTDGDNTAGTLDPLEAAELAKTLGIKIYTIAVGSNEPVPFPVQGFWGTEYRPQLIRMNTELLEKIAAATGGRSFVASSTEALQDVYATIDRLEKSRQEWEAPVQREERAQPWLLLAAACLLLEQLFRLTRWRPVP